MAQQSSKQLTPRLSVSLPASPLMDVINLFPDWEHNRVLVVEDVNIFTFSVPDGKPAGAITLPSSATSIITGGAGPYAVACMNNAATEITMITTVWETQQKTVQVADLVGMKMKKVFTFTAQQLPGSPMYEQNCVYGADGSVFFPNDDGTVATIDVSAGKVTGTGPWRQASPTGHILPRPTADCSLWHGRMYPRSSSTLWER